MNGTVNSIKDAVAWLSYTFLFVRMCKNPMSYGLNYEDTFADPQLNSKRMELIVQAAQILDRSMMARYDPKSGNLGVCVLFFPLSCVFPFYFELYCNTRLSCVSCASHRAVMCALCSPRSCHLCYVLLTQLLCVPWTSAPVVICVIYSPSSRCMRSELL